MSNWVGYFQNDFGLKVSFNFVVPDFRGDVRDLEGGLHLVEQGPRVHGSVDVKTKLTDVEYRDTIKSVKTFIFQVSNGNLGFS